MRRRIADAVVASILVIGGCSSSSDTGPTSPASAVPSTSEAPVTTRSPEPVEGLLATIGTNRLYAPNRQLGLGLQNVGDVAVHVREIQLVSELFAPVASIVRDVELPPRSRRLVLPLPYGEVRCDDAPVAFDVIVVTADDRQLRLPAVEEYPGSLGRLHERECAAADVRARVVIAFGEAWTRRGVAITGDLTLSKRTEGPPVAIDDAVGNVIFTLVVPREDGRPVLRVTDAAPTATARVTISADRCDPHAVAEFKRPFTFLSWLVVGAGDPVPVELEVTGSARAALEDLLRRC